MTSPKVFLAACFLSGMLGCGHQNMPLIQEKSVDSLLKNYQEPRLSRINDRDLLFWKNRINPHLPGLVSESKYAGALSMRFHLYGDIHDLQQADSVVRKIDLDYKHQEAQAYLTLVSYSILQHRFKDADSFLIKAKEVGLKPNQSLTASFDVDFETGNYYRAHESLKALKPAADYGYFFRRSKWDHLTGNLDSSIHAMEQAADEEKSSPYLEQVALSNTADLYIHAGELGKAASLYMQCLHENSADFHSLTGLGWIALVHDHNVALAERIFSFVGEKNKLPDAFFKLTQMAELREDPELEKKYAETFEKLAADSRYGNMYNKYLIELYTGVLNNPLRAEAISKKELENRSTPQTHAWYAWSLFANHKKEAAYAEFERYVSGKPLEGLELYWMGKLMQGMNKGYNAQAFYKAAYINKYDLSPAILQDLEKQSD